MNHYTLRYTMFDPTTQKMKQAVHKKWDFESELDILGALDEALTKVVESNPGLAILPRAIELTNAQEIYKLAMKQES